MKSILTSVSFALLSTVLLLGCQDMGFSPVEPVDLPPQFDKKDKDRDVCPDGVTMPDAAGHCHGGDEGGGGEITWSSASHVAHQVPEEFAAYTLQQTCPGPPAGKLTNPSVKWEDGEDPMVDGCVTVTTELGTTLTNDAYLIVAAKNGDYTFQFLIQDIGGAGGTQYGTDRFSVDGLGEFTGAGFVLHVHSDVDIWRLKNHTGGPRQENVGRIYIGDIRYN